MYLCKLLLNFPGQKSHMINTELELFWVSFAASFSRPNDSITDPPLLRSAIPV